MTQNESTEQQSDNQPVTDDELAKITQSAARRVRNRFHGYVELEDVMQVAILATYEIGQFVHWKAEGQRDKIYRRILKECALYAHKEKAAQIGYRVEDLFFYKIGNLREVIPAILESWSGSDGFEFEYPDRAVWVDVSMALTSLTEAEYQIIWWAFKGDPEEERGYENVASHLGISADAARQRVNRLLRRMLDVLGGEDPVPRKRVRSNAAALAETRNSWDGQA